MNLPNVYTSELLGYSSFECWANWPNPVGERVNCVMKKYVGDKYINSPRLKDSESKLSYVDLSWINFDNC
jgi:hypothetical protein